MYLFLQNDMTREVLQIALEYMERHAVIDGISVRDALRKALAQPEQCLDCGSNNIGTPANYDSLIDSVKLPEQEEWTPEDTAHRPDGLAQPEQNQFKPDYDTEAVLVEEMQRMAKQIAEMQDWEAVASDQAMTIAMMQCEQEQEQVGYMVAGEKPYWINMPPPLGAAIYTSPPQRQPMKDEHIQKLAASLMYTKLEYSLAFARAIEAAHGIGDKT